MGDLVLRYCIGGLVVSVFAVVGDVFKPKTFAGLFGAAPSVALATLALTLAKKGGAYVAIEARSMCLGATALAVYALAGAFFVKKLKLQSLAAMCLSLPVWFAVAFALYFGFLGGR